MKIKLFYSWQSDLTQKYNRYYIETCLKKAIKAANREQKNKKISYSKNKREILLDQATRNTKGAPEITTTIFSKINECSMFVADISIIGYIKNKFYPNSNVLTELGYAAGKIGWENIVLLFNTAYGKPEDLPFDLRGRRLLTFNNSKSIEASERIKVKQNFIDSLSTILSTQLLTINPIEHDPLVKLFVYVNNKLVRLVGEWNNLINELYKTAKVNKTSNLGYQELYEEFDTVCSNINPKSKPSGYYFGHRNWYEVISHLCNNVTIITSQIFQFQDKVHFNIIDRLTKAETIISGSLFISRIPFRNLGNTDITYLSRGIIDTTTYLNEALSEFNSTYAEHRKEHNKQYSTQLREKLKK